MPRILLVEDDADIVANLTDYLKHEGFSVDCAAGQSDAMKLFHKNCYDLALLDVSLSDGNGFSVCSALKSESLVPVVFLTASGDEYSVVTGLDIGADDYISKPFRPRELVSRINSVLRRAGAVKSAVRFGNIAVDTQRALVTKNGRDVYLSALEYRLMLIFAGNPGVLLTRSRLLEEIRDVSGEFVNDNTLTVYIKRLREKLEDDPQNPKYILTVRGLGYKLEGVQ